MRRALLLLLGCEQHMVVEHSGWIQVIVRCQRWRWHNGSHEFRWEGRKVLNMKLRIALLLLLCPLAAEAVHEATHPPLATTRPLVDSRPLADTRPLDDATPAVPIIQAGGGGSWALPEPATLALLGLGLAVAVALRRRAF